MRVRDRRLLALLGASAVAAAIASACAAFSGTNVGPVDDDSGAEGGATSDGSQADANLDPGTFDDDAAPPDASDDVLEVDIDASADAADGNPCPPNDPPLAYCASTGKCLRPCTKCPGHTYDCFSCPNGSISATAPGTCVAAPASCPQNHACDCTGPYSCPGAFQVCMLDPREGGTCLDCGEMGTGTHVCRNAKKCVAMMGICN
jgi:hypothetical protein